LSHELKILFLFIKNTVYPSPSTLHTIFLFNGSSEKFPDWVFSYK
jgi:hypothetical protein